MPAGALLTHGLARYRRRFGGEGTIVTLADGRAFTAAHCLAAVDGRPGTVVVSPDGRAWRVVRRWSPRGRDLALLRSIDARSGEHAAGNQRVWRLAEAAALCPGVEIEFYGHTGQRFQKRRAVVTSVTVTRAVAEVRSPAGVASGDSGGPVLVGGMLAGIVIARTGEAVSSRASARVVLTRLDCGVAGGGVTNRRRQAG